MKDLIQHFQKQLAPAELRYIDEDWGQLDYYEGMPPVGFPCALIEVQGAEYTNDGEHQQKGLLTVVVKVFSFKLSNSSDRAPQSQKDEAKKSWVLLENVNKVL